VNATPAPDDERADPEPPAEPGERTDTDDGAELDDLKAAAQDVVASLRRFVDAAEQAITDEDTFGRLVDGGRGVVESFMHGFAESPRESGQSGESRRSEGNSGPHAP